MELIPALYLIPVNISNAPLRTALPDGNLDIIKQLRHFIVENVRTARRFLKRCDPSFDIGSVTFYELNRHTDLTEVSSYLNPLREGVPMGVMSEAGCPAVADPGALPVSIAQRGGFKGGSACRSVEHTPVAHGIGLQRSGILLQRLFAHRPP